MATLPRPLRIRPPPRPPPPPSSSLGALAQPDCQRAQPRRPHQHGLPPAPEEGRRRAERRRARRREQSGCGSGSEALLLGRFPAPLRAASDLVGESGGGDGVFIKFLRFFKEDLRFFATFFCKIFATFFLAKLVSARALMHSMVVTQRPSSSSKACERTWATLATEEEEERTRQDSRSVTYTGGRRRRVLGLPSSGQKEKLPNCAEKCETDLLFCFSSVLNSWLKVLFML